MGQFDGPKKVVGLAKRWSGALPEVPLALGARDWYDAGARLIGGCCRTTPADIRALSDFRKTLMADPARPVKS